MGNPNNNDDAYEKVIQKHNDILTMMGEERVFGIAKYCHVHIEEACDGYYSVKLTKSICNSLSELFKDLSEVLPE